MAPRPAAFDEPVLRNSLWGIDFVNPIGLAAGFDKDGRVPDAMLAQGFGFVEVGGVTPRPQAGNPRPRVFRLPSDGAVINRLGLNSEGLEAMAVRLRRRRSGPVGVNLGMNAESEDAVADYVEGARSLAALADYLVVNVSSPNTPGLRALQGRDHLEGLLAAVQDALADLPARPPLLLKIAPDLTPEENADIAEVALAARIDGLIATNTTIARPATLVDRHRAEAGGLSGRPLFGPSTAVLGEIYRLTRGRIPLIGVGGVASGRDAYAKIRAGASLVQLYTALIYDGPGLVARIKRELWDLLRRDGFATVAGGRRRRPSRRACRTPARRRTVRAGKGGSGRPKRASGIGEHRPVGAAAASRAFRSRPVLLRDDAFFQVVFGVEQEGGGDAAVLADDDPGDVAHLGEVGDRADRALGGVEDVEDHGQFVGQQGTAPAARPVGADRRQRQHVGADRHDGPVGGQVVGGATGRGRDQHAVADQFPEPHDAVHLDADLGRQPGLAKERDLVDGECLVVPAPAVCGAHAQRV